MKDMPKITEAEWAVMKVFWEKSPLTANQVVDALNDHQWNPKTIRTLINRLQKKGALGYEKEGRQFRYFPLVAKHECIKQEAYSLLKRAGAAALKPMLATFIQEQNLSEKEIDELREILKQKDSNS